MSERSIAEILGWTEHTTDSALIHLYRPPDGYWRPEPTVDDMLAWLAQHNYFPSDMWHDGHLEIDTVFLTLTPIVEAYYAPAEAQWPTLAVEGTTLHAALEAAVRAVAEATP